MLKKTAIRYYLQSIPTLLTNFNWWVFPLVVFTKPVLIKIKKNHSFYVSNFMDIWTLKEVIVDKNYEQFQKVRAGDFVVDVGAAIGDFNITAAKKAKKVIAYECDRERLSLMRKNLTLAKVSNVVLKPKAAKTLKEILEGIDACAFFKIDCDGGEYDIFRNAHKSDLDKIQHIAMEAHQFDAQMKKEFPLMLNMLKKNNFEIQIVPNPVHDYICFVFATNKSSKS